MEYLDIYDSNGNSLGKKVPRKEVHDKGLWHRSVHVWVLNSKGELLIQKRSHLKYNHPNMWDISVAGHVSAGDNDVVSVLREVEEEIGLKLKPKNFLQIGEVKQIAEREGYINNEINPVYVVKIDLDPNKIKKQESEVAEVKFISFKELKRFMENKDSSFVQHPEEYKLLFNYLEK